MNIVTPNQQLVQCEILTDLEPTVENGSVHNDTEPTDCTLRRTARQWME